MDKLQDLINEITALFKEKGETRVEVAITSETSVNGYQLEVAESELGEFEELVRENGYGYDYPSDDLMIVEPF